ncbi:MAG: carbon storage regulator CsrA [Litorivicinus sp.]
MLVLSRKIDEGVVIGDNVTIRILDVKGKQVRIGIEAPREVRVNRAEVFEQESVTPLEAVEESA